MGGLLINMDNLMDFRPEGFQDQKLFRLPLRVLEEVRSHPFTRQFVVTDLGCFPSAPAHRVDRPQGSPQQILIVVDSGTGWAQIGATSLRCESGHAIYIPAGTPHSYGSLPENPWAVYWFHFEGQGALDLLTWTEFHRGKFLTRCQSMEGLRRHFRAILQTVERGYQEHTLLELSRSLINVLTLLHRNPLREHRNDAFEQIERSMDEMKRHLHAPMRLDFYARAAGLSVPQFSHLFKQHTGTSPMTYFTELRIQQACEYLDNTGWSMKEIATRLGYDDPLYFSRAFKKCTGLSPRKFRERV